MKEVIKKILKEANVTKVSENSFFNKVLNLMGNPPYLPLLYGMGLSKEDIIKVFELMYRNLGEERTKVSFDESESISVIDPVFHNRLYYEEPPHHQLENTTYWEKWDYWSGTNEWKRYVDMNGDRRFRSKNGIQTYGKDIEPEDMEDGFYPPLSTGINEGIGNSQIKKRMNTLFLDKVLKELVRDTELDRIGLHLPFHYGSLYISSKKEISKLLTRKEYDYRESFYGYVMDLYSLSIEESVYCYPKYVELLVDKFNKTGKLTLESVSPQVSKVITHKGKLNFIDRITDMMMDETYVTDIEPSRHNNNWYVEGMRRIYFYKGDNSLGGDDAQGIIQPGESWVKFMNKYNRELFDATFKHLKRLGAGNMDMDMEVAVWTEYVYKLRDKYFGGGDDPLLY